MMIKYSYIDYYDS